MREMIVIARDGPDRSQESGTQSGSLTWVAGTPLFQPEITASPSIQYQETRITAELSLNPWHSNKGCGCLMHLTATPNAPLLVIHMYLFTLQMTLFNIHAVT